MLEHLLSFSIVRMAKVFGYPEVGFITGLSIAIRPSNTRQFAKSLIQESKKLSTTAKAEMAQGVFKKNCLRAVITTTLKPLLPV